MKTKHTPGPWHVSPQGGYVRFTQSDNTTPNICDVHEFHPQADGEREANARLIAAAPEMLDALENTLWSLEDYAKRHNVHFGSLDVIRKAIEKAEGRQASAASRK